MKGATQSAVLTPDWLQDRWPRGKRVRVPDTVSLPGGARQQQARLHPRQPPWALVPVNLLELHAMSLFLCLCVSLPRNPALISSAKW